MSAEQGSTPTKSLQETLATPRETFIRLFPLDQEPTELVFLNPLSSRQPRLGQIPNYSMFAREDRAHIIIAQVSFLLSEFAEGRVLKAGADHFEQMTDFMPFGERVIRHYYDRVGLSGRAITREPLPNLVERVQFFDVVFDVTNGILDAFMREYATLTPAIRWMMLAGGRAGTLTSILHAAPKLLQALNGQPVDDTIPDRLFQRFNDDEGHPIHDYSNAQAANRGHCINMQYAQYIEGQTSYAAKAIARNVLQTTPNHTYSHPQSATQTLYANVDSMHAKMTEIVARRTREYAIREGLQRRRFPFGLI